MPLVPPADNSKSYFAIAIGVGLALVIFVATRANLPSVGDNIHSLPHGGYYRDGTKEIFYGGPNKRLGHSATKGRPEGLLFLVLALVLVIHLLSKRSAIRSAGACCASH